MSKVHLSHTRTHFLNFVAALLTTMSTEKPSKRFRADNAARSFEGKASGLSLTSMPLPMAVDSNYGNDMVVDTGSSGTR